MGRGYLGAPQRSAQRPFTHPASDLDFGATPAHDVLAPQGKQSSAAHWSRHHFIPAFDAACGGAGQQEQQPANVVTTQSPSTLHGSEVKSPFDEAAVVVADPVPIAVADAGADESGDEGLATADGAARGALCAGASAWHPTSATRPTMVRTGVTWKLTFGGYSSSRPKSSFIEISIASNGSARTRSPISAVRSWWYPGSDQRRTMSSSRSGSRSQ